MKKLITIITISLISTICYSQDSVRLKITRVGSTSDKKTYYWLRSLQKELFGIRANGNLILWKPKYVTLCECKRKKGEVVTIAKKDLIIIKDSFTKKDLENGNN